MLNLILPPISEVKDIVLDLMPTIKPDADSITIKQSVILAENLISLLDQAETDPIGYAVLKAMLNGIVV